MEHYNRQFEKVLSQRLREAPQFIQLVSGPRQVGKTTGVQALLNKSFLGKFEYFECEESLHSANWFLSRVQLGIRDLSYLEPVW